MLSGFCKCKFLLPVTAVLLLSLAGCAHRRGQREELTDALDTFGRGIRYGEYRAAAAFLPQSEQDGFVERMERRGKDLSIVEERVTFVDLDEEAGTARVEIIREAYSNTTLKVTKSKVIQTWKRDEQEDAWLYQEETEKEL